MNVIQKGRKIDQEGYINEVTKLKVEANRSKDECLSEVEKRQLRGYIGQLGWISKQTRPDLSFNSCEASVRFKNASVADLKEANKVITFMQNNPLKVTFPDMGDLCKVKIVGFADAAFRNLDREGSQGGYLSFLVNADQDAVPISWASKKVKRSTLAAETMAITEAFEGMYYLKLMWGEMTGISQEKIKTEIFTDNR